MAEKVMLEKNYNPASVENKWYSYWLENNMFAASVNKDKTPYTIVMPPPNVTGELHMGHAMDHTLQDILIRAKRMMGFEALWIPGTDHAGIATQKKVEDQIKAEGHSRHSLGREEFIKRVWKWRELYGDTIINQFKRLGLSCDWSRLRFTLDGACSRAVREAFDNLYHKGLIYKGQRLINWCPRCLTALSDLEVEHEIKASELYYIKYPAEDGNGSLTIATTRPETILADVAVCVHPEDERYKDMVGRNVILPIAGRALPVIADEVVEQSFGTGALKITPAHDPTDYEIGIKYGLEMISIIDEQGKMTEVTGKYACMDRFKCREAITLDLKDAGLLEKVEDYSNSLGKCYRCGTVIEPHLSWQWFVSMEKLAKPALKAEKEGRVKFYPERHSSVYCFWLENIRDWCISRQLWWGHRIPVWTCSDCGHTDSFKTDPERCPKCSSLNFVQEEDVLDTWFSSALWPLSTLGWPVESEELDYFYPTNVLVTARDIIFLWVARMIMMGLEFKNEVPFRDVHIHATILGKDRRRMSKSLGTGVDPILLIEEFGTDALRFALTYMTAQGQDIVYSKERVEMARNFVNKIWNAARFCLSNISDDDFNAKIEDFELTLPDEWILHRLNEVVGKVSSSFDTYSFEVIASELYNFFWSDFCDWYIEIVKPFMGESSDPLFKKKVSAIFIHVFDIFLRLIHPVTPFVSEELYSIMFEGRNSIMLAEWPEYSERLKMEDSAQKIRPLFDTISAVRSLRADLQFPPKKKVKLYVQSDSEEYTDLLNNYAFILKNLAGISELTISSDRKNVPEKSITVMIETHQLFVPADEIEDLDRQVARIEKEIARAENEILSIEKKFANESFMKNAHSCVIESERNRMSAARIRHEKLTSQLKLLK